MSENLQNNPEEVDLGSLFALIGKGINNVFKGIANFVKIIFHYLILGLIFLKKHAIILGTATILGGVLGYVLNINKPNVYESGMILETNFGSGHQLYKQINYLNALIKSKKNKDLATVFKISENKAETLLKFDVEPHDARKNLLKQYDEFIKNTDTIFTKGFTFEDFYKRFKNPDYRYQVVTVKGSDKNVFTSLNKDFNSLIENDYFKNLLDLKTKELEKRTQVLTKNLVEVDSLRAIYKKVALLNANKENVSGTSISLQGKESADNKDMDLFIQTKSLLSQLRSIDYEKIKHGFIIHKITEFSLGEKSQKMIEKKWFVFAILGFLLALSFILILKLNKFLNDYQLES